MSAPQIAPYAAQEPAIAIDNRVPGSLATCPVCGREFRLSGRNWKRRAYCRRACANRAWMAAHPRRTKRPARRSDAPRRMSRTERLGRLILYLASYPLGAIDPAVIAERYRADYGARMRTAARDIETLASWGVVNVDPTGVVIIRVRTVGSEEGRAA